MTTFSLSFKLVLWAVFAFSLTRTLCQRRLRNRHEQRVWMIFFLCCVTATLWGSDTESAIDRLLGGLTIAVYAKCLTILLTARIYSLILHAAEVVPDKAQRSLNIFSSAAIALTLIGLAVTNLLPNIHSADVRYPVNAGRDLVFLAFVALAFLPGTYLLRRAEHVLAMRFKHTASLLFFSTFALCCLGNGLALGLKIAAPTALPYSEAFFSSFVYPCFIFFGVSLLPHRWLLIFFQLPRFRLYCRLHRLERLLSPADSPALTRDSWQLLLREGELELAIYQATIAIMDYYPSLEKQPNRQRLYEQIQALLSNQPEYSDLIKELTRIAC